MENIWLSQTPPSPRKCIFCTLVKTLTFLDGPLWYTQHDIYLSPSFIVYPIWHILASIIYSVSNMTYTCLHHLPCIKHNIYLYPSTQLGVQYDIYMLSHGFTMCPVSIIYSVYQYKMYLYPSLSHCYFKDLSN